MYDYKAHKKDYENIIRDIDYRLSKYNNEHGIPTPDQLNYRKDWINSLLGEADAIQ